MAGKTYSILFEETPDLPTPNYMYFKPGVGQILLLSISPVNPLSCEGLDAHRRECTKPVAYATGTCMYMGLVATFVGV